MSVAKILATKGDNVFSIPGNTTVYEALKTMGERNVGALPIIDEGKLVGILSERDYARKIILKGKSSRSTLVSEIMTENPITVSPEDKIDTCMNLMTEYHVRHLPVIKEGKVIGMISIGDVVSSIIVSQKEIISHLQNYISQ